MYTIIYDIFSLYYKYTKIYINMYIFKNGSKASIRHVPFRKILSAEVLLWP